MTAPSDWHSDCFQDLKSDRDKRFGLEQEVKSLPDGKSREWAKLKLDNENLKIAVKALKEESDVQAANIAILRDVTEDLTADVKMMKEAYMVMRRKIALATQSGASIKRGDNETS